MILQIQALKRIQILNETLKKITFCRIYCNLYHHKKCKISIKINPLKILKFNNSFRKV